MYLLFDGRPCLFVCFSLLPLLLPFSSPMGHNNDTAVPHLDYVDVNFLQLGYVCKENSVSASLAIWNILIRCAKSLLTDRPTPQTKGQRIWYLNGTADSWKEDKLFIETYVPGHQAIVLFMNADVELDIGDRAILNAPNTFNDICARIKIWKVLMAHLPSLADRKEPFSTSNTTTWRLDSSHISYQRDLGFVTQYLPAHIVVPVDKS